MHKPSLYYQNEGKRLAPVQPSDGCHLMQNMSVQTFSVSLGLAAAPGSKRCLLSCLPAYGQATIDKIHCHPTP